MSKIRSTKRGVEAAKRDKAQRKQERKTQRAEEENGVEGAGGAGDPTSVIESLRLLHERFDDGQIDFDTFEAAKAELLARLG
jgi:hypothetical protein